MSILEPACEVEECTASGQCHERTSHRQIAFPDRSGLPDSMPVIFADQSDRLDKYNNAGTPVQIKGGVEFCSKGKFMSVSLLQAFADPGMGDQCLVFSAPQPGHLGSSGFRAICETYRIGP